MFRLLGLACSDASQAAQPTKPSMPSIAPTPVTQLNTAPSAASPSAQASVKYTRARCCCTGRDLRAARPGVGACLESS